MDSILYGKNKKYECWWLCEVNNELYMKLN